MLLEIKLRGIRCIINEIFQINNKVLININLYDEFIFPGHRR